MIRSALISHRAHGVTHERQPETAVRCFRKSRQYDGVATAAGIEGLAVIFDRDHNAVGTDLNRHINAQLAALRRAVAHDVADDLLEDQFNIVAGADPGLDCRAIECAEQMREALFEAARRPRKAEPNRMRVDAMTPGGEAPASGTRSGQRRCGVGLH